MSYRYFTIPVAGAVILSGCQAQQEPVDITGMRYELVEAHFVEPDCPAEQCAEVEVRALHFPDPPELSEELRTRLLAMGQGISDGGTEWPRDSWEAYAEAFFALAREDRRYAPPHAASQASLEAKVLARHHDLLVIELGSYVYHAGQAHGMPLTEFMVIDERLEREVALDDLLLDGQAPAFQEALARAHERWLRDQELDEAFAASWPFYPSQNVAPLETAWVVRYNVYEITPYALGQPELSIPLAELEGIAKPRYLGQE